MANTPKKIKDPTEAALSAIQDALAVRDTTPAQDQEPDNLSQPDIEGAIPPEEPLSEPPWRATSSASSANEVVDEDVRSPEEQGLLRRPANDDRESIGQILRGLQRRPARTSYLIATVFAVVWLLAGLMLGWMYLPQLQAALSPSGLTAPVLAILGAIFLAPIIFFYGLAHMAWRSQELRLITQSMAEVAMRLA